jgi:hypothetical protein
LFQVLGVLEEKEQEGGIYPNQITNSIYQSGFLLSMGQV